MRKLIGSTALALGTLTLPLLASAADASSLLTTFSKLLTGLVAMFITLAIVVFFYGLIKYLINVGEEKSAGLSIMFYGVIAIFVMVSIWGIIRLLQNTLGVSGNNAVPVPSVPVAQFN